MTRRSAWLALAVCALAGSSSPAVARPEPQAPRFASPGRIVAADVAFSQLAQRKGQWTAFRATAAEDAVMFVPQPVVARQWLKAQKDPARSVTWQPHQVWLSCDGSLAVSQGAWQRPDGGQGYYTTVWQRQKNGEYKWVMDQGDELAQPLVAPEMIGSGVAACVPGAPRSANPSKASPQPSPAPAWPAGTRGGWSEDRTLSWAMTVDARCGRALTVSLLRGAGKPMEPVLERQVAAPTGTDGRPSTSCPAS